MARSVRSLLAQQVHHGQVLTFSKARTFPQVEAMHRLPLSAFFPLEPGSKLTFTWLAD